MLCKKGGYKMNEGEKKKKNNDEAYVMLQCFYGLFFTLPFPLSIVPSSHRPIVY